MANGPLCRRRWDLACSGCFPMVFLRFLLLASGNGLLCRRRWDLACSGLFSYGFPKVSLFPVAMVLSAGGGGTLLVRAVFLWFS